MRFGWRVFPLLLALSAPGVALADPQALDPATEAKRTALFEEGRTLHLSGKHAEAVVKLREVVAIRKSPQALRALGLAEQDAGMLLDARANFEEALRMAKDTGPASEVDPAKKALATVEPMVPHIKVTVPPDAPITMLRVDGAAAALKDGALEVDPGQHTITAEAKGKQTFSQSVKVEAGGVAEVTVELRPVAQPSTSLRRPIGIALAGVGAAGLVLGGVTGGLALAAHDDLAKKCPGGFCQGDQVPALGTYHALGVTSTVGFVAGGVLAAAGVVLFVTAPRPAAAAAVQVVPYVGLGGAGVRVAF